MRGEEIVDSREALPQQPEKGEAGDMQCYMSRLAQAYAAEGMPGEAYAEARPGTADHSFPPRTHQQVHACRRSETLKWHAARRRMPPAVDVALPSARGTAAAAGFFAVLMLRGWQRSSFVAVL